MDATAPLPFSIGPDSATNVLGVDYFHSKTSDGGDIYLTRLGHPLADFLEIENWYEKNWFEDRREKLLGTGSVYKVPTKPIDGRRLHLVVKNCRMGENVPLDTHTLLEFVNAEFNSPWEEFSLVMEMRENAFGPARVAINTQAPLAIYVPPEKLQLWQTGRSRSRMNKIAARHPGIDLDILRQYKLVYQWIEGMNLVEMFEEAGIGGAELEELCAPLTKKVIADLDVKGYAVADMKPVHIIIGDDTVNALRCGCRGSGRGAVAEYTRGIYEAVERGAYSVVDYELLLRTEPHERQVKSLRRHSYLDHQRDRFKETPLPAHLKAATIFGVPYIYGHAESTGGLLWVVGNDPNLFDFFLPERWRKTPSKKLSSDNEVYYTVTKDNVHIVWKTSKVGEKPLFHFSGKDAAIAEQYGFNSPFEEFAIAQFLNNNGVPTVYVRAIYVTGSVKLEQSVDTRRYERHKNILSPDGDPVLREDHNYITIRGYYNGPDRWVAEHDGQLLRPVDLIRAFSSGMIAKTDYALTMHSFQRKLASLGYDGSLLSGNDVLLTIDGAGAVTRDDGGMPEARICNFELLGKRQ